jgi:hypothetical protein
MRTLISLAALAAYSTAIQLTSEQQSDLNRFAEWQNRFNKHYNDGAEHTRRFNIWLALDSQYQDINSNEENSFSVAHNQYSDWSKEEFDSFLLLPTSATPKQSFAEVSTNQSDCVCADDCGPCACNDYGLNKADSRFDWREATTNTRGLRAVNRIVDQSTCSASWAFAAAALIESQDFITNSWNGLQKYSE